MSRIPTKIYPRLSHRLPPYKRFSNYCLHFDGVNQGLYIVYAPSTPITVKFWFGPAVNNRYLFGTNSPAGDGFYGYISGANQAGVGWVNTVGGYVTIASTNLAVLNRWNHLAFTLDGAAGTMTMLLNNVLTTTPYVGIPRALNPALRFATYVAINYFEGLLDEISLLNAVEPVSELRGSYYRGYAQRAAASRIILRLEEGTDLTAYDASGFGNNGALYPVLTPPVWTRVAKHELLAEAEV